ncbi:MAG: PEP-CTERM sorting domain-containing protein [Rubripirellula sp.]
MIRLLIILTLSMFVHPASAALVYSFSEANYEVTAGSTVDVTVFLQQQDATGDPIDLTIDGLVSAGVRVTFDTTPPSDRAEVLLEADITPNPLFDDTSFGPEFDLVAGESAGFVDSVDDVFAPITGNNILLGTFRFTAGSVIGEVTNVRAVDFGIDDDTFAGDFDFTILDGAIGQGISTITVTAVPEPSSLGLLLVGGTVVVMSRRRRRRRKSVESFDVFHATRSH